MIDETIEELKQVKQTLEELQGEYELLLGHKKFADKTIDMYAEKCKALEKELNDWQDGTIIVKWCKAEEKCKVLEKALEMACEQIEYDSTDCHLCKYQNIACESFGNCTKGILEYFIQKAKEE